VTEAVVVPLILEVAPVLFAAALAFIAIKYVLIPLVPVLGSTAVRIYDFPETDIAPFFEIVTVPGATVVSAVAFVLEAVIAALVTGKYFVLLAVAKEPLLTQPADVAFELPEPVKAR